METQTLLTTVKRFKEERQSFVTVSEDKNGDRRTSSNGLLMEARQLDTPVERKPSAGELIDFNKIIFVFHWTFFSNCNLFITGETANCKIENIIEDLVNKFETSTDTPPVTDNGIRKRSTIQTVSTSRTLSSTRTSTMTNRFRPIEPPSIKSKYTTPSSTSIKSPVVPVVSSAKSQPAKRSNSIELTSGMPEDKAALLVRKFFGNSVIETKKSRITKTETIMEEASEMSYNSSFSEDKPEVEEILVKTVNASLNESCEDILRPSSQSEVMSTSSFGSVLDMIDTTTDDDRSIRSSTTMTNTTRYSSCSERSVKLSDIINRPDRAPLTDSAPSSPPATPLDEFSCATSESASIPFSFSRTATDTSSTGSASIRSASTRSGSIRRNKTQRHPTVIRKDRSTVPVAVTRATGPKIPTRSRPGSSTLTGTRSSASASPSTVSSSSTVARRRSDRKSADSLIKPVATKSSTNKHSVVPVRPPRMAQPVNPSTDVKRKSTTSRISSSSAIRGSSSSTVPVSSSGTIPSSRIRTSATSRLVSAVDTKVSSSSGTHLPLSNRTNRLVTITSYKAKSSGSGRADETSGLIFQYPL